MSRSGQIPNAPAIEDVKRIAKDFGVVAVEEFFPAIARKAIRLHFIKGGKVRALFIPDERPTYFSEERYTRTLCEILSKPQKNINAHQTSEGK